MKVIVFTNARDEPHILEWISHYLNLGFDHIFIYDHKSEIPISSLLAPKNLSKSSPVNRITVTRLDNNISNMKNTLMRRAVEISKQKGFDWMLYIDADEFLHLKNTMNIKTFLSYYNGYHQVSINWLMFGSNFMDTEVEGTLLEKYTRSGMELNKHVKSFVNPRYVRKPLNPHVYELRGNRSIHCENKPLGLEPHYFETKIFPSNAPAYFAHYIHQSYDVYIKRKVSLPRDDNGQFRIKLTEGELHQRNNDIITLDMLKYNEQNNLMTSIIKNTSAVVNYTIDLPYIENYPVEEDTIANEIVEDTINKHVEGESLQNIVEIIPVEA
jgi:hypothetical protein